MPKSESFFKSYFNGINAATMAVAPSTLEQIAALARETSAASKKIILAGNGASAAMASHVAVDFTKAARVRAVNFNEADLLTCLANDYGYEQWVVQALEFYADPGDLAILISSSGKSSNIVNGARKAKAMGLKVVTLSGFDSENPLRQTGHINLWANSRAYNIVEMTHHIWLLAIVDYLIATE